MLDQAFWEGRYESEATGWDLGVVSPPIKAYIDQLDNKGSKILIPGAGYGHEVVYLAEQGFKDVTVVDISKPPLEHLATTLPPEQDYRLIHQDFFDHSSTYDLILEQTFFCALDPVLRVDYVSHMQRLLKDGGRLVGLLFDIDFERAGPPFGGSREAYLPLFKKHFSHVHMEACYNSIAPRQGNELFINCQK